MTYPAPPPAAPMIPAWPPAAPEQLEPLPAAPGDQLEPAAQLAEPATGAAPETYFYDSAAHEFPPGAEYVMVYADGDYAYDAGHQWPHVHAITVLGDARFFSADYEPGNQVFEQPGKLRQWADRRLSQRKRAIVYCDRYDLHRAHDELGPAIFSSRGLLWWIPTLDGRRWTAQQLTNDIASNWGVWIPPARIWGNQFQDQGRWDISTLFGIW